MRNTGIAVLAVCLVLMASVAAGVGGCGGDEGAGLTGRWTNEEAGESIEFRPDGTVTLSSGDSEMELTYEIEGDTISLREMGSEQTQQLGFSLNDDALTLTAEGRSMRYDRTE